MEEFVANGKITAEYFIAGLGSFSTKEMTFASDIDLIFVVNKLDSKGAMQREFQNILLKLKDEFSPFTADCRLRPEGKSSLLVWELGSYADYLKNRARIWELQAFTKLSFVCGEKELFTKFLNIEMAEMRKKTYPKTTSNFNIKKSRGGITDIEFVVQYLILCNPNLFKKCAGNSIIKNIAILAKEKPALEKLLKSKDSYSFLKTIELLNQNIFNNSLPIISYNDVKTQLLAKRMNIKSKDDFLTKLHTFTKLNQNLLDEFLR